MFNQLATKAGLGEENILFKDCFFYKIKPRVSSRISAYNNYSKNSNLKNFMARRSKIGGEGKIIFIVGI